MMRGKEEGYQYILYIFFIYLYAISSRIINISDQYGEGRGKGNELPWNLPGSSCFLHSG